MTISIRRAEREDIPTLLSLIDALAEFESLPPPDEAAKRRFAEDGWSSEGRAPRFTAWLAEVSLAANEAAGHEEARFDKVATGSESAESSTTDESKTAAAYAITFETYSSFLARPTLYLEDIFVLPAFRRQSVGSAMMSHLITEARSSGCGRVEWVVLDWNTDAQQFYRGLGASHLTEWQTYRLVL